MTVVVKHSLCLSSMAMDRHKPALNVPYNIFRKEGSFANEIRRAALERVCLTLLRLVHISALTEFFMEHIKEIMTNIQAKPVKVGHI